MPGLLSADELKVEQTPHLLTSEAEAEAEQSRWLASFKAFFSSHPHVKAA